MENTSTSNPCRLCGNEITNGRGKYKTADGLVCFSCLSKMTRTEKKVEEVAAKTWTAQESEKELRELKRQEYLDAQAAIVELLFPLEGLRSAATREILDKIKSALKTQDILERALKVNSLVRAASPAIEQTIRELQKKKQSAGKASTAGDPITATAEGGR